jgi:hypothetical protein
MSAGLHHHTRGEITVNAHPFPALYTLFSFVQNFLNFLNDMLLLYGGWTKK